MLAASSIILFNDLLLLRFPSTNKQTKTEVIIHIETISLQNFSTEDDVEKLAATFKKQEEENFALFNYVNELSHEVETLNETVHQLRENVG